MQSLHLSRFTTSLWNICKYFNIFIRMLLPMQSLQRYVLISHLWRDVGLSSCNCLGLKEIETEGVIPPARDFVSQYYVALYCWMMNTNLIILGSPGCVFFCKSEMWKGVSDAAKKLLQCYCKIQNFHCIWLFFSLSKLNSISLHVSFAVKDIKLLQSHAGCGNALNEEICQYL